MFPFPPPIQIDYVNKTLATRYGSEWHENGEFVRSLTREGMSDLKISLRRLRNRLDRFTPDETDAKRLATLPLLRETVSPYSAATGIVGSRPSMSSYCRMLFNRPS